ncbi:MAG TPA: hypothetical protein EYP56_03150 [Planctomycetaceae bacterium]|nr:hypothetical protein [Planctomycetaceae bacterium]HIQ22685.1 hypothetical protein [Planctomycetota bacterium]
MASLAKPAWVAVFAGGVVIGLILAGLWPQTPLHAVATDRQENFLMATGWVDEGVEAVYLLDATSGALRAKVLSNQRKGFQAHYEANVGQDLAALVNMLNARIRQANAAAPPGTPPQPEIQIPQTPNYMMVTGVADIRRGAAARAWPSTAVIYVAETNTGIVMCYVMPWNRSAHSSDVPVNGALLFWAGDLLTAPLVKTQ